MTGKTNCNCNVLHICNSAGNAEVKAVSSDLNNIGIGKVIHVKFTYENTYGGYSNHAVSNGVKLSVNGITAPVRVGGELAGVGFARAGDVHAFVYDGSSWHDLTTDVIYRNSAEVKFRNGTYMNFSGTTLTVSF
ncbi:MAG: hypothetical protein MJ196_07600 [Treponemataceae bacterium]|nr:hypothetical protein [Treponemataceae bacterium]